jgi:hypothetical protein
MFLRCAALMLIAASTPALAQSTPRQDAMLGRYFALWDDNGSITPGNIAQLYADRVIYYGRPMTRADLYEEKRGFVRQWPERRYTVEPGTATRRCDDRQSTCVFTAVLDWRLAGQRGAKAGRSRINLTVAEAGDGLKIVREGAVTLAR